MGRVLPPRFAHDDPTVVVDPYPHYAQLRAAGQLCRFGPGQWGVTRHADVSALLRDRRLAHGFPEEYRRFAIGDGPATEFFGGISIVRDPPEHTRLRALMSKAFSPALVRRLSDHLTGIVDELLEPALDTGILDAATDLAYPLPVTVVCELLGVPTADRDIVRPRAADLARGWSTEVAEADRPHVHAAVVWLREYLGALLEERRHRPGDDLLSRMLAAGSGEDSLSQQEIVDNAVFLFFAGFETTRNMIGTGCAALLRHPNQLARLRAEPGLAASAVEEFLRYDAPVQGAGRMVLSPIEIGGHTVRAGRVLVLLLGSANHDESVFERADRLDVGRSPNPHVSFGGGTHFCLGAALAREEGRVAFERLLHHFATIEPAGEPVRRLTASGNIRAYDSVPMQVRPR
ncbi:cytochrome P450 [Luedemannella helvata]|uniref:cytochrome P450 n=1 Tax=Luedemannella helvata TaxID=349315 RepID=UPI0031E10638